MFNNRNNHSQMPNQEEKICTLKKKKLRTLLMYTPRKCWRLEVWKGSCGGELLRKAVLRKGGGQLVPSLQLDQLKEVTLRKSV